MSHTVNVNDSLGITGKVTESEAMCRVCFSSKKAMTNILEGNLSRLLLEVAEIDIPSNVLKEELSLPMSPDLIQTQVLWFACADQPPADHQIFSKTNKLLFVSDPASPINFNQQIKEENLYFVPIIKDEPNGGLDYDCDNNQSVSPDKNCEHVSLDSSQYSEDNGDITLAFDKKCDESIPLKGDTDESKVRSVVLSEEQQLIERQQKLLSDDFLHFPFRCLHCVKGFNFEVKLERHMKLHDEKLGQFECNICHMRFHLQSIMDIHKRQHGVRFECQKCEYSSVQKLSTLKHYRVHHEGAPQLALACQYCKKIFRKKRSHRLHEESHESKNIVPCEICGKTYANEASLLSHRLLHTAPKDLFCCDICGKGFALRSHLTRHSKTHTSATGDFYCVKCNKFFKNEITLKTHLSRSSKHVTVEMKFKCDQCDKVFQFANTLKMHIQFVHTEDKKYSCSLCEQAFVTLSRLKRHQTVRHEGIPLPRKHMCDTCGKGFPAKTILENHMRTHTGERPFVCGACGQTFKQKSTLHTHNQLVHLKIKRIVKRKKKVQPAGK